MKRNLFDSLIPGSVILILISQLATSTHAAVNISTQATQNMNCSAGVCTATAQKAYLNVNDVTSMLADGDLKIATGNLGAQDVHIEVPFSWTSTSRLTLDAQRSIEFHKSVTVAGTGALTIITNDGGTGGDYWFDPGASVSFWDLSSSLVVDGRNFTLVSDIKTLASDVAKNASGSFALAKSYDAAQDGNYTAAPVAKLEGQFDGLGNAFSNLTITSSATNAVLGLVASSDGTIRDTILRKVVVQGSQSIVGALVGNNSGWIRHCRATGTVAGTGYSLVGGLVGENSASIAVIANSTASSSVSGGAVEGGLVGLNEGTVEQSSSAGTVSSNGGYIGGLVGENADGLIDQSSSSSAVTSNVASAGGLAGYSAGGLISHSHASGRVKADTSEGLGGLVGWLWNQGAVGVFASYATGNVRAHSADTIGGLVGFALGGIDSSFATGDVRADSTSGEGGLVGTLMNDGTNIGFLENSYSTGAVEGPNTSRVGGCIGAKFHKPLAKQVYCVGQTTSGALVGGFVGEDIRTAKRVHSNIHYGYWDLDKGISNPSQGAGNIPNDPGIVGLTDAQLKTGLPEGFRPKVWGQDPNINNGYPYLLANPPPKSK